MILALDEQRKNCSKYLTVEELLLSHAHDFTLFPLELLKFLELSLVNCQFISTM